MLWAETGAPLGMGFFLLCLEWLGHVLIKAENNQGPRQMGYHFPGKNLEKPPKQDIIYIYT